MVAILQAVFSGLALGGIYALVALGFNITHTTTKTFNFGQGEFLAVGTLIGVSAVLLLSGKDITEALSVTDVTLARYGIGLIASIVILGIFGVLLYFTAVRPFVGMVGMAWVMSTIGFGIIIQNTALAIWGPTPIVLPSPLGNDVIRIGGAGIVPQEIL
ncbi:MAG TPA: branched-chain amino acid ABC transporter permease, partial [Alcaligenaceae bacterium]|nr:branched-chain amino acid ABC transporter permease [Alcaligenaceae bacterium]